MSPRKENCLISFAYLVIEEMPVPESEFQVECFEMNSSLRVRATHTHTLQDEKLPSFSPTYLPFPLNWKIYRVYHREVNEAADGSQHMCTLYVEARNIDLWN